MEYNTINDGIKFDIISYLKDLDNIKNLGDGDYYAETGLLIRRKLKLPNSHEVSIQRSTFHYCDIISLNFGDLSASRLNELNFGTLKTKDKNDLTCELGFPTFYVERLMKYAENRNDYKDTVYCHVPIKLVEDVINSLLNKGEDNE